MLLDPLSDFLLNQDVVTDRTVVASAEGDRLKLAFE